ncbi:hypothetical protein NX059_011350 [Plenodomus lindquistii]|nr:hypothetical protein NX059_011350 [Plenodomus lindquistii]
MPMAWATIAAAPAPPLTPSQRMQDLRDFYAAQPLRNILQDTLGLHTIPGTTGANAALIEHAVVIGIDTEAWTRNTNEMTEIGLAVYERKDMVRTLERNKLWELERGLTGDGYNHVGPFGEELLKEIMFYHLRIVENAHLKTNAKWMKGAEGNRFAHSRFVTFPEARVVLDAFFDQPIVSDNPELAGCKRPIILVGHAISHDRLNCKDHGLQYDWFKHGTIVKEVDTQPLAKATNTWFDYAAPNNDVGLETLTRVLGFEHTDPHTALNDAARTLMAAIVMALPKECKQYWNKDMQAVALGIEAWSRWQPGPDWGSALFCTRCAGRDHDDREGNRCTVSVHCKACAHFDGVPNKENTRDWAWDGGEVKNVEPEWATHVEECCLHIAEYNAWIRRCNDATRKRRALPPGPPEGAHPGSDAMFSPVLSVTPAPIPNQFSRPQIAQSSSRSGRGGPRGRTGHRVRRMIGAQEGGMMDSNWRREDDRRFAK